MASTHIWRLSGVLGLATILVLATAGTAWAQATRNVAVELTEWALRPSALSVPTGTTVVFTALNPSSSRLRHAIHVRGPGVDARTEDIRPGGPSQTLRVTFAQAGRYEFFCPVDNGFHRERGMDGSITVVAGVAAAALPPTGGGPVGLPLWPAAIAAAGSALALGAGIAIRRRR